MERQPPRDIVRRSRWIYKFSSVGYRRRNIGKPKCSEYTPLPTTITRTLRRTERRAVVEIQILGALRIPGVLIDKEGLEVTCRDVRDGVDDETPQ